MNNDMQIHNMIYRDTVLGVILLVSAAVLFLLSAPAVGLLHTAYLVAGSVTALGGLYFLQNAFKKDKERIWLT